MKDLIIVGAGGFGREVAWLTERINKKKREWNLLGFLDDGNSLKEDYNGYKVIGTTLDVNSFPNAFFACAIGAAKIRERVVTRMTTVNPSIKFATLIDPSVEMSDTVSIGEGSIICAHTILTVNISVGRHVIVNLDCTVGHDAVIDDFVTIYPSVNVSGSTSIGHAVELGTGTQIIQEKAIGQCAIVGAGSVVVKDIPDKCVAVGIPAKPIRFLVDDGV